MRPEEIVVVRHRKSLRIGFVQELTPGKVRVTVDRQKAVVVPQDNVLISTGRTVESQGELDEFVREVTRTADAMDLREVWELAAEGGETVSLEELAELAELADDTVTRVALAWHVASDSCPFFDLDGESCIPVSAERVAEEEARAERQRREAEEDAAFLAWLEGEPSELTPETFSARQSGWLDRVLEYVVEGDEAGTGRLKSLLASLPSVGGDPRRALFKRLVGRGVFAADEHLDLRRFAVPIGFSEEVESAALAYRPDATAGAERVDLRPLPTLSIDDATTADIDDAVSVEKSEGGWRLYVHVTDLTCSVPDGSALDAAARARVSSHYFPDRKIPMLPAALSERLASLVEGEERPVVTLILELDEALEIRERRFARSTIVNRHRTTYDDVDRVLEEPSSDEAHAEALGVLDRFAAERHAARIRAGAVELDRQDIEIRLDEAGEVTVRPRRSDSRAQRIVSELMILYNVEAAAYCRDRDVPAIYRTHEGSRPDEPEELEGLHAAYRRYRFLRAAPPPGIGLTPGRHGMLGIEPYCQASSPLRRYIDLLDQRQLATHLSTGSAAHTADELSRRLYEAEERLRELRRLEFDRNRYWLLTYLKRQDASEYDAVVLETGDRTCQVEVLDFALRAAANLHGDPQPGQVVRVRVTHTDPWDGAVRFSAV